MGVAEELFRKAGLRLGGSAKWGQPIPVRAPGVYVIEAPAPSSNAPFDDKAVAAWVARIPGMLVDGQSASAETVKARLAEFWIPSTTVVYIGLAGTSLATRLQQYYKTPLGDSKPHAGGHWLRTLRDLTSFTVSWAESDNPARDEDLLLRVFAKSIESSDLPARVKAGPVLPFANRQTADGTRKTHGIGRSVLPPAGVARVGDQDAKPRSRSGGGPPMKNSVDAINRALQKLACGHPDRRVSAVEGAAELDRLGLLRDSRSRRGMPLRIRLRKGVIESAYQEGGRFWFIECAEQ